MQPATSDPFEHDPSLVIRQLLRAGMAVVVEVILRGQRPLTGTELAGKGRLRSTTNRTSSQITVDYSDSSALAQREPMSLRMLIAALSGPAVTGLLLALLTPALGRAQDRLPKTDAELAAALIRYGGSMIGAAATASDTELPKLGRPDSAQREALQKTMAAYKTHKAHLEGTVAGLKATAQLAIDGTAATLTATGVGVVPATIVKAGGQLTVDYFAATMDADVDKAVKGFLAARKDQLKDIGGLSYEQLQSKSPAQIRQSLQNGTDLLDDVDALMPGDEAARQVSVDLLIDGIKNTQLAMLDTIEANQQGLQTLSRALTSFSEHTRKDLQRHAEALTRMQSAVGSLAEATENLDRRLAIQERNQTFIADFVFQEMSPRAKANALKGGFLNERFACSDGSTDCDAAALKESLLNKFEAEAALQEAVRDVGKTAESLQSIATIAANLGFSSPELEQAAAAGMVVAEAFALAATGNPLGAIASASGLFGARVNPDQARHAALISHLERQFKEVNAKLEAILQNQQKLMDAIADLSHQVSESYRALDRRLGNIEIELKRVSFVARQLAWEKWEPCSTTMDFVRARERQYRYFAAGDFNSVDHLAEIWGQKKLAATACISSAQSTPAVILDPEWFESPLNARLALKHYPDELPPHQADDEYVNKETLEFFITHVQEPSAQLVREMLSEDGIPLSLAVFALASPTTSFTEPWALGLPKSQVHPCDQTSPDQIRGARLVCSGADDRESLAAALFSTPMVFDAAPIFADWLLLAGRLHDFERLTLEGGQESLISFAASNPGVGPGRQMAADALLLLDAAIAGHALLYGELPSRAVHRAITAPRMTGDSEKARLRRATAALELARVNPPLARNVAMLLLRERYGKQLSERVKGIAFPANARLYRQALELGFKRDEQEAWQQDLNGLFGDDLSFSRQTSGPEALTDAAVDLATAVDWAGGEPPSAPVLAEIPLPEAFGRARVFYPPRMGRLLSKRSQVIERLLDYDVYAELSAEERGGLASLLAREARSPD